MASAMLMPSFSVANAASVELKINGSKGPAYALVGSTVIVSWTTSGVYECNTGISPAYPHGWGSYRWRGASGSEKFTLTTLVADSSGSQARFAVQCSTVPNGPMVMAGYIALNAVAPTIAVTAPNGGEALTQGQAYNITWTSNVLPNITEKLLAIDYSSATPVVTQIASVSSNQNSYAWQVPANLKGNKFKVAIVYDAKVNSGGYVEDLSDNYFSIVAPAPVAPVVGVSINPAYPSKNVSPNSVEVKIGSYVIQNQSTSESVKVTNFNIGLSGTESISNLSALRTSETSGSGAVPIQPQASNNIAVDFTLAPGAAKTIDIFANSGNQINVTVITALTVSFTGLSSNISGTTSAVTGQTITFASASVGSLNAPALVMTSSTPSQYIAAAGGAIDASKATFNFTSTGGTSTITELKFITTGTNVISAVRVGSATAVPVSGVAYLTGLNLVVPNGGAGFNVDVYTSYASVGTTGIPSGSTSNIALSYVKYTTGGTTQAITPMVSAPTMTLVGSKPAVTLGSSTISSFLMVSPQPVYLASVTVTANAKGGIALNQIPFVISGNSGTRILGILPVVKDGSGVDIANAGQSNLTGNDTSLVTMNITFPSGYVIPAGTSQTFTLGLNMSALANPTSVTTSIGPASSFLWTDVAGSGAASAGTGTLMYNFPTNSISIHN